jgi:hypothetical protein
MAEPGKTICPQSVGSWFPDQDLEKVIKNTSISILEKALVWKNMIYASLPSLKKGVRYASQD